MPMQDAHCRKTTMCSQFFQQAFPQDFPATNMSDTPAHTTTTPPIGGTTEQAFGSQNGQGQAKKAKH